MKDKHRLGVFFLTLLLLTGCATTEKFARYEGRALKFGIPLYQGVPPENYTYKSLGYIKGEYKNNLFDGAAYIISKALENLANNAKLIGANAVIKIKGHSKGLSFYYDGEAVIFDNLPIAPNN
jgi:hypothetical protein